MIHVSSFYVFKNLTEDQVQKIEQSLNPFATAMRGLILLGTEGINATVSGPESAVQDFKAAVLKAFAIEIPFKDSTAKHHPFKDFKIQLRKEIVTLGRPDLVPTGNTNHLTAKEWHETLLNEDVVVLDTRNTYETDIGKFENAVDLKMDEFREFPEKVKALGLPKDKKVLMYCTGGIRCEKAILEMNDQGYENVFQLQGGILEYLKEFPDQKFQGECFVFDYRVAVDQKLNPSERYRFCPHCGQPAVQKISCALCKTEAIVCVTCIEKAAEFSTCSKNCAHHHKRNSKSRKPHHDELSKRLPV